MYDVYKAIYGADIMEEEYFYFLFRLVKGQIEHYLNYEIEMNAGTPVDDRITYPMIYMIHTLYLQKDIINKILSDKDCGISKGIKQFTEGSRSLTYDSNIYNAIFNSSEVDKNIPREIKQMLPLPRIRLI